MKQLKNAVEYIIKKCTSETESGTYFIHADDFPAATLPPKLFTKHISAIAEMMLSYAPIAEADVEDDAISIIMYLDYLP